MASNNQVGGFIRNIFSVSRRTFLYPTRWMDANAISDQTNLIITTVKPLFTKPKPGRKESFDAAVKRLELTKHDIKSGIKSYHLYAWILLAFGFLIMGYGFFALFAWGSFNAWLLSMAAMLLAFAQAFRFDFWAFQMEEEKLGLTIKDWYRHRFGDNHKGKSS